MIPIVSASGRDTGINFILTHDENYASNHTIGTNFKLIEAIVDIPLNLSNGTNFDLSNIFRYYGAVIVVVPPVGDVVIIIPLQNDRYPYSINIPLQYNITNGATCYYTLDGGITNYSISCTESDTYIIDIDFDGNYTLELYAVNASTVLTDSAIFEVARPEFTPDMAFLILVIFGLIFLIASACLILAVKLKKELAPIKLALFMIAGVFFLLFLQLILLGLREYIKNSTVYEFVSVFYLIYTIFLFVFILYNMINLIIALVKWLMATGKIKWRKR